MTATDPTDQSPKRVGYATCPDCGKARYLTKQAARAAIRRMKGRRGRLNAYRCGDFWHIGHLPDAVRHGEITRDDLTPKPIKKRSARR